MSISKHSIFNKRDERFKKHTQKGDYRVARLLNKLSLMTLPVRNSLLKKSSYKTAGVIGLRGTAYAGKNTEIPFKAEEPN
jgi:hypothetical protein